ncbi:small GTP-binding protein, putative [Trichomonas vaginalis G3]|uniref:Small GTP-binding protein, putative n=1 Tax=Trichomonas vaginalis (strain ATCC PRA-98 / G3) TaxID=412133 RepID=A2EV06_TRIV3|nr:GTPase protein [Trichomonas vaginalis G3]EAY03529.1 small GTP-binding protein, putative [Trichomonas vaginalis G3]KAI5537502.1 GTPase protein [Trichomonas vaginalis G3]|eukprot:XP_001315752.1 small GTP-binding protein [Trichomonas vaginalis G3]
MTQIPEYKIVTIGDHGVGQTCLIMRYYYGEFQENPKPTVGAAYVKVKAEANNHQVQLNLWDTAGQEKYSNLIPIYVQNCHAVIICYDLTEKDQLQKVQAFINTAHESCPPEVPIVVVGTKSDKFEGQNPGAEVGSWCMNNNIEHFITSAATGFGIDDLFVSVATNADKSAKIVNQKNTVLQKKRDAEEQQSGGCC